MKTQAPLKEIALGIVVTIFFSASMPILHAEEEDSGGDPVKAVLLLKTYSAAEATVCGAPAENVNSTLAKIHNIARLYNSNFNIEKAYNRRIEVVRGQVNDKGFQGYGKLCYFYRDSVKEVNTGIDPMNGLPTEKSIKKEIKHLQEP